VVTQDDNVIDIEDQEAGTQYKIELAENKLKNYPFIKRGVGDLNEEEMVYIDLESEEIQPEQSSDLEEALYEIELDEEDDFGGNKGDESRSHRDYEANETYGGNKGDESRSRRDYETNEIYGGNKGDESMSDRDYSAPTKMYGGKKGDMSKSRRDYK
jgi:hypothetical protein